MSHSIRFHVLIIPTVSWPELLDRVRRVEALGFEAVALPDHLVDWSNPPAPWYDAWTALAALAQATSTIRLTTVVTQIPLRNPAVLARQVLTLDHISNGRIELGLGTGLIIDPSYRMSGLPNWTTGERASRFGEYVELVSQLLSQETTTYAGRYYQADGAVLNPRPVQSPRPPILVAALGPQMLRHAVRHADIWNTLSFQHSFDDQLAETRVRCATVDRICAELDRDPATLQRSYTMFDPLARQNDGALSCYHSPEAFVSQIEPLLDLGITDIGLYYPFLPDQLATFEQIATDVLSRLRTLNSLRKGKIRFTSAFHRRGDGPSLPIPSNRQPQSHMLALRLPAGMELDDGIIGARGDVAPEHLCRTAALGSRSHKGPLEMLAMQSGNCRSIALLQRKARA